LENRKLLFVLAEIIMDLFIIKLFLPEVFLSTTLLGQLLFNSLLINTFNHTLINKELFYQLVFISFCLIVIYTNLKVEGFLTYLLLNNDQNSKCIKIFISVIIFLITPLLLQNFALQKLNFFEYFSIMFFSIFSLLLINNSMDMISLYLLIEMQSLSFYVLVAFKRNSVFCVESGLKYFISGSIITGVFLLGCSFLYGVLGTLNFANLYLIFSIPINSLTISYNFLIFGVLLITITFLFKLSSVPFHFWNPDVYDGSPLSTTIFFSIVPKITTFYLFTKWLLILGNNFEEIKTLLSILGVFSLSIGTLFTFFQKRIKRFIIYSSIAQNGFLITACALLVSSSITSIFFFIFVYVFTLTCLWSVLSYTFLSQEKYYSFLLKLPTPLFLSNLNNTIYVNIMSFLSFTIVFFSMAGIPPLSGFISKFFILLDFVSENFIQMSLILIVVSSISVYYYIKIIKVISFESISTVKKVEPSQIIYTKNLLSIGLLEFFSLLVLLLLIFCNLEVILLCEYLALSFNF
jgi:NADH-quinone oxidoreductase subunit N